MTEQEKIVAEYFDMWVSRDGSRLPRIFSRNALYVESWGPEYHGLEEIQRWFREWNERGTVREWTVRRFLEQGGSVLCEWYFECEYDGVGHAFNGVSWVVFDGAGKIAELREYQSALPNYDPFEAKRPK